MFIKKVLMEIDKMADVFLNTANIWQLAFFTLTPPTVYPREVVPNGGPQALLLIE
jgi:hypothetical protein